MSFELGGGRVFFDSGGIKEKKRCDYKHPGPYLPEKKV